jgi:hypothetical protein
MYSAATHSPVPCRARARARVCDRLPTGGAQSARRHSRATQASHRRCCRRRCSAHPPGNSAAARGQKVLACWRASISRNVTRPSQPHSKRAERGDQLVAALVCWHLQNLCEQNCRELKERGESQKKLYAEYGWQRACNACVIIKTIWQVDAWVQQSNS